MKTIHKPWGREEWLELNDKYCYKRIYINAGYKTSYQYHNFKKETNYIISGEAEIWLENDEGIVEKTLMKAGDYFNVTPPKKHRVIALTDIILQEVSTPEVDDVFRIDDEFARTDGKIEGEHQTPAVLILTSGLGTRLGSLTKEINKALLPINNRAIISHIIEKFPKDYEFVIALGYKGDVIKEYCKLAYPNHKFNFVKIDKIDGEGSGPGYSTLQCKQYLQRPFYITTCDCLIDSPLPHIDGNWLGTYPTSFPEKYSTLKSDDKQNIIDYKNKSLNGFDSAFIGLGAMLDYSIFWKQLENNIKDGELVCAFENPSEYPTFKIKNLKWLDTGNLDDLNKTRDYFNDKPLSLKKDNNEITYKEGNTFIKFNPNVNILNNIIKRAKILKDKIPYNFKSMSNLISYEWQDGNTLYEIDSFDIYINFLNEIKNIEAYTDDNLVKCANTFYVTKTKDRLKLFLEKNNDQYYTLNHEINGIKLPSMEEIINKIDLTLLNNTLFYKVFHGDLQFDNIIFNKDTKKFTYIDWRESFGGNTDAGDIYYDLAKLYGGSIIPYDKMKNENNLKLIEGSYSIQYSYSVSDNLQKFKTYFENWIIKNGYDLNKVKLITGLIFLNMSPLHDEKFSKMLWFKSIEMLYEHSNK